ncbi:MAG: hypothetical protein Fur0044_38940 [Anaerolineae bacterium]|nr:hypothetical protein [Anaerolineales bacterium]MCQ3975985.1 hypothetical protein [Anaerolineae bacterium]
MITKSICTDQVYRQINANQESEKSVWAGLRRLAATIGDYAVEIYRYSNDPEPVFSNGGTRVLSRPDRIDLV